jgi:hypothetical protein
MPHTTLPIVLTARGKDSAEWTVDAVERSCCADLINAALEQSGRTCSNSLCTAQKRSKKKSSKDSIHAGFLNE